MLLREQKYNCTYIHSRLKQFLVLHTCSCLLYINVIYINESSIQITYESPANRFSLLLIRTITWMAFSFCLFYKFLFSSLYSSYNRQLWILSTSVLNLAFFSRTHFRSYCSEYVFIFVEAYWQNALVCFLQQIFWS